MRDYHIAWTSPIECVHHTLLYYVSRYRVSAQKCYSHHRDEQVTIARAGWIISVDVNTHAQESKMSSL